MIQSLKHFAVNWTDGMKISEKHFDAHDDFILDTVRDANSLGLNAFNYGLLPAASSMRMEHSVFDVYNTATNDVQVVIKHCSAITAAGFRIDLSDYKTNIKSLTNAMAGTEDSTSEHYYILVSVNPFERIPFGDIDPEETPPHHPYTQPRYSIELLPVTTLGNNNNGGNYLIIGQINLKDNVVEADPHFIPPSTSIHSHPALVAYYSTFAKAMANLQQYAVLITQKTVKANQNTSLSVNVKALCKTLIDHIGNVYFSYRNIIPHQPPVHMVGVFAAMALHLYNNTQALAAGELEEMLNYTFEWSEIVPHTLLNQLSAVAEINYNHNNCGSHLLEIQRMLKSLEIIFGKLSTLDYIGQRKENIIVTEKDITPASKIRRGWSLLD